MTRELFDKPLTHMASLVCTSISLYCMFFLSFTSRYPLANIFLVVHFLNISIFIHSGILLTYLLLDFITFSHYYLCITVLSHYSSFFLWGWGGEDGHKTKYVSIIMFCEHHNVLFCIASILWFVRNTTHINEYFFSGKFHTVRCMLKIQLYLDSPWYNFFFFSKGGANSPRPLWLCLSQ